MFSPPVARSKCIHLANLMVGLGIVVLTGSSFAQEIKETLIDTPFRPASGYWPDTPPQDCPFPRSESFSGLEFTGRHAEYTSADTWYPSWASDDKLYSPFADGSAGGVPVGCGYFHVDFIKKALLSSGTPGLKELVPPLTGYALIEGNDPLELKITRAGAIEHQPFPYGSQYPCGSLVYNGIWYYGTYAADWEKNPWDILGPFVGFHISTNLGKTWQPPVHTSINPLFGESGKNGKAVKMWAKTEVYDKWSGKGGTPGIQIKIGAPHFVDFGKNMEHSPDAKAYLVAHGAERPEAFNSWASGDQVYLLRVKPSPETMNDPKAYEFYAGRDTKGEPVWSTEFQRLNRFWNGTGGWGLSRSPMFPD